LSRGIFNYFNIMFNLFNYFPQKLLKPVRFMLKLLPFLRSDETSAVRTYAGSDDF